MEVIVEFILELLLEGSIEVSRNIKVPKYIRYPLIFIISLLFLFVICIVILVGVLLLNESVIGGSAFILLGLFMLVSAIIKFKKMYLVKVKK